MRKISACIVSYNGADEVIRAVESLLKYTKDCALTVYLVDNASPDGTGETLNINLGFQPSAVLIFTNEGQTYTGSTFGGLMTPTMPLKSNNATLIAGEITETGFTVYGRNVTGNYLSSSNRSYCYLAFQ